MMAASMEFPASVEAINLEKSLQAGAEVENEEATSTTEEEVGSPRVAEESSSSDSDVEENGLSGEKGSVDEWLTSHGDLAATLPRQVGLQSITEEQKQEGFRQYAKHFGVDHSSKASSEISATGSCLSNAVATDRYCSTADEPLLRELENDLAGPRPQPKAEASTSRDNDRLHPTFGYAGSLDEAPCFAKFDIRDHICMKVGGFKHGEVVRDGSGGEMVVVGVKEVEGVPRLWLHPKNLGRPGAGAFRGTNVSSVKMRVKAVQASEVAQDAPHFREMKAKDFDAGEDSDGEEVLLCRHCKLPVGEVAYLVDDKNMSAPVHGECMPHLMQTSYQDQAKKHKDQESKQKASNREQYDIGWQPKHVPLNTTLAVQLGCSPAPQGMCCLVYNEEEHSVQVAPTLAPAESLNLEYLSLALQVRLFEGREPLFSLDPVQSTDFKKDAMQGKRFEPEWLAGTSVGDVLFQADYHLKELSMGEYEQPIVGMKSCFDLSEQEDIDKEWNAREWFVVRKAEVLLTDGSVLVPRVRMGVEAREQVFSNDEFVDVKCNRPNHPLVRYADQFTKNFDLIAERKSVIFHLRELARAAAMAKMIVDGDLCLQSPWLEFGRSTSEFCAMEVPQLWNHRDFVEMRMRNGQFENAAENGKPRCHGVYGGVNFGLERAGLTMPSSVSRGRMTSLGGGRPAAGLSAFTKPVSTLRTSLAPSLGMSAMASPPQLVTPMAAMSASGIAAPSAAFSAVTAGLSKPVSGILQVPAARIPKGLAGMLTVGKPSAPLMPTPELLGTGMLAGRAGIAAVSLRFPPRPGMGAETSKLALLPTTATFATARPGIALADPSKPLITAEKPRGVDLNLDEFSLSEPTRVQGYSWGSEERDVKCAPIGSAFWSSLDGDASDLKDADKKLLKSVFDPQLSDRRDEGEQFVPPDTSFDYVQRLRSLVDAEELCRKQRMDHFFSGSFSISSPGSLFPASWAPSVEVHNEHAVPGFSTEGRQLHARPDYKAKAFKLEPALKSSTPIFERSTEESIVFRIYHIGKLEVRTCQEPAGDEIVGAVFSMSASETKDTSNSSAVADPTKLKRVTEYVESANDGRRSFVVLETHQGNVIVTEKLVDGTTTWQENPRDLVDRKILAKVVRTAECTQHDMFIRSMRNYQLKENTAGRRSASCSQCKFYAQSAYSRALGEVNDVFTGFRKQEGAGQWQLSERKYGLYATSDDLADEPQVEWEDGQRPIVGDVVQVKESGRKGTIQKYDGSDMPYQVVFQDGQRPQTRWYKECQLRFIR